MADPECIRKFGFEPTYSFRRDYCANMNPFRMPMHSTLRYSKQKIMQRSVGNRRMKLNKPHNYDDDEVEYRRRRSMRYSSCITGSMFEEEEYYYEYTRRESERAYTKLKKEIEEEPDEYVKTMMQVTLMEMELEYLKYEVEGLQDEHNELQRDNYTLKQDLDEMGINDEYAPPAKKARSPNIPFVRAGHRKLKNKSDRDQYDEHPFSIDGFKFEKQPNYFKFNQDTEFYDLDAVSDTLL